MSVNTRISSDGTMADRFKIGKAGPTILQGTADPNGNSISGKVGDLYVHITASPVLYIQSGSDGTTWVPTSSASNGFSRQYVTTSGTTTLNPVTTYVGVSASTGSPIIQLTSAPLAGIEIVIKDEGGMASTHPITIMPDSMNGYLIDGNSSVIIQNNYGSLTLMFNSVGWSIVQGIFTAVDCGEI